MTNELQGVAHLSHLGVIRVVGADAPKFLHGQLTQDFSLLGLCEARLSAYCSPKGRMLASFLGFKRSATEVLLICNRDLLAATLKRLTLFVMRADVKLSDVTSEFALFGLAADAMESIAGCAHAVLAKLVFGDATLVVLHPAGQSARALWLAPAGSAAPAGLAMSLQRWQWGEVQSGVAMVSAAVVDAFVPQMLNYESVGGVNFKKGCYPGQEVVARSQFRGTIKRRACIVHASAELAAGDEVYSVGDHTQPCGTVVQAAPNPAGGYDAIACVLVTAAEAGHFHLKAADGPEMLMRPLPYALLQDL